MRNTGDHVGLSRGSGVLGGGENLPSNIINSSSNSGMGGGGGGNLNGGSGNLSKSGNSANANTYVQRLVQRGGNSRAQISVAKALQPQQQQVVNAMKPFPLSNNQNINMNSTYGNYNNNSSNSSNSSSNSSSNTNISSSMNRSMGISRQGNSLGFDDCDSRGGNNNASMSSLSPMYQRAPSSLLPSNGNSLHSQPPALVNGNLFANNSHNSNINNGNNNNNSNRQSQNLNSNLNQNRSQSRSSIGYSNLAPYQHQSSSSQGTLMSKTLTQQDNNSKHNIYHSHMQQQSQQNLNHRIGGDVDFGAGSGDIGAETSRGGDGIMSVDDLDNHSRYLFYSGDQQDGSNSFSYSYASQPSQSMDGNSNPGVDKKRLLANSIATESANNNMHKNNLNNNNRQMTTSNTNSSISKNLFNQSSSISAHASVTATAGGGGSGGVSLIQREVIDPLGSLKGTSKKLPVNAGIMVTSPAAHTGTLFSRVIGISNSESKKYDSRDSSNNNSNIVVSGCADSVSSIAANNNVNINANNVNVMNTNGNSSSSSSSSSNSNSNNNSASVDMPYPVEEDRMAGEGMVQSSMCFSYYDTKITSLVASRDGCYVYAAFSSGRLRLFDMTKSGYTEPEDRFGHLIGKINNGSGNSLSAYLIISDTLSDACGHLFLGCMIGSTDLHIIDLNSIREMKRKRGFFIFSLNDNGNESNKELKTFSMSDSKLHGLAAVRALEVTNVNISRGHYTARYQLFCGKGYMNFNIWDVSLESRSSSTGGLEYSDRWTHLMVGSVNGPSMTFCTFINVDTKSILDELGGGFVSFYPSSSPPSSSSSSLLLSSSSTHNGAAKLKAPFEIVAKTQDGKLRSSIINRYVEDDNETVANESSSLKYRHIPNTEKILASSLDGTVFFGASQGDNNFIVSRYLPLKDAKAIGSIAADMDTSLLGNATEGGLGSGLDHASSDEFSNQSGQIVASYSFSLASFTNELNANSNDRTSKRSRQFREIRSIASTVDGLYAIIICSDNNVFLYSPCDIFDNATRAQEIGGEEYVGGYLTLLFRVLDSYKVEVNISYVDIPVCSPEAPITAGNCTFCSCNNISGIRGRAFRHMAANKVLITVAYREQSSTRCVGDGIILAGRLKTPTLTPSSSASSSSSSSATSTAFAPEFVPVAVCHAGVGLVPAGGNIDFNSDLVCGLCLSSGCVHWKHSDLKTDEVSGNKKVNKSSYPSSSSSSSITLASTLPPTNTVVSSSALVISSKTATATAASSSSSSVMTSSRTTSLSDNHLSDSDCDGMIQGNSDDEKPAAKTKLQKASKTIAKTKDSKSAGVTPDVMEELKMLKYTNIKLSEALTIAQDKLTDALQQNVELENSKNSYLRKYDKRIEKELEARRGFKITVEGLQHTNDALLYSNSTLLSEKTKLENQVATIRAGFEQFSSSFISMNQAVGLGLGLTYPPNIALSVSDNDYMDDSSNKIRAFFCVICQSHSADCVILDCGHVCLCHDHAKQMSSTNRLGKCPQCTLPCRGFHKLAGVEHVKERCPK